MKGELIVPEGSSREAIREYAERVGYPFERLWEEMHAEAEGPPLLSVVEAFGINNMLALAGLHDDVEEVFVDDGRFRLIRRVGTGSYGTVYEAKDLELDRVVALKVMPVGDPDVADRESKALAAVNHPNIVQIFDHGRFDDYRWLVLEFIGGPTLDEWCEGKTQGQIVQRFLEAGEGLQAAHRRGLIHRDFKPRNVMVDDEGRAKVTDFGLARSRESLDRRPPEEGHLIASGTLAFLSRERLRGAPGDERSDQFAFCVSLWWLLAERPPFAVSGSLKEHFDSLGRPPSGGARIPRRLRRALERGMSPVPGDRWPTMAMLLEKVRAATKSPAWLRPALTMLVLVTSPAAFGFWRFAPPEPKPLELQYSEVDAMTLEVLRGIEEKDNPMIVQALSTGYPVARREGRQADFSKVARLAAKSIETNGGSSLDSQYAWWMAARLSEDAGTYSEDEFSLQVVPTPRSK